MSDDVPTVIHPAQEDLKAESMRKAIENLEDELTMYSAKLDEIRATKEHLAAHRAAVEKIAGMIKGHSRKLHPEFEYEENPEYWEQKSIIEQIAIWQQGNKLKIDQAQADVQEKNVMKELERIKRDLNAFKGE